MIESLKKLIMPRHPNNSISKLNSFDIHITSRCNSTCTFCSIWKEKSEDLEIKYLMKYIHSIAPLCHSGSELNIIGGEPTLRPELLNILQKCNELNITTYITSNGYRLSNYNFAKKFISFGIRHITLSLEGFEDTNTELRGKGSYRKVIEAIKNIRSLDNDIKITIQSIICRDNIDELPKFSIWLKENNYADGIRFQAIVQDFAEKLSKNWYLTSKHWPRNYKNVAEKIDELVLLKKENPTFFHNHESQFSFWKNYFFDPNQFLNKKRCNVDEFHVQMDCHGGIQICPYMEPIGNIKNHGVRELLNSKKADEIRRKIRNCSFVCNFMLNCRYDELIGNKETN